MTAPILATSTQITTWLGLAAFIAALILIGYVKRLRSLELLAKSENPESLSILLKWIPVDARNLTKSDQFRVAERQIVQQETRFRLIVYLMALIATLLFSYSLFVATWKPMNKSLDYIFRISFSKGPSVIFSNQNAEVTIDNIGARDIFYRPELYCSKNFQNMPEIIRAVYLSDDGQQSNEFQKIRISSQESHVFRMHSQNLEVTMPIFVRPDGTAFVPDPEVSLDEFFDNRIIHSLECSISVTDDAGVPLQIYFIELHFSRRPDGKFQALAQFDDITTHGVFYPNREAWLEACSRGDQIVYC